MDEWRQLLEEDLLPGGLGDDKPEDDFDPHELKKGIEVESEHTPDEEISTEIAKDHLTEIPDYYSRLENMEKEALQEATINADLFMSSVEIAKLQNTWLNVVDAKTLVSLLESDDEATERFIKSGLLFMTIPQYAESIEIKEKENMRRYKDLASFCRGFDSIGIRQNLILIENSFGMDRVLCNKVIIHNWKNADLSVFDT